MNFYISKIRLWFKQGGEPRDLDFFEDKVNVITGDSSTGKSSVLKIIDYCLLSERSTIVEDVINENVKWYGMVFYVNDMPYTIIRPSQTVETTEMKAILKEGVFLPEEPMIGMDDLRTKAVTRMNEIFGISPKMKLDSKVKLQFRHNLVFNYLTEDIIASENTYQDLRFFRKEEYEKVLNDLFKLAIGINELKIQELEAELKKAEGEERRKQKTREKEIKNQEEYEKTKRDIAEQVEELGLGNVNFIDNNPMSWADDIKRIVDNCNLQFKNEEANQRRRKIDLELADVQERLGYFVSLENEYKAYLRRLERQSDSLVPLEYVKRHLSELMSYQETGQLLRELTEAWRAIKESYVPDIKLPENFEKTRAELRSKEKQLKNERKQLNPYQLDQKDVIWLRKAILLADRMEKELTKIPRQSISDEMLIKCSETKTSIKDKLTRLKAKNENAIGNLNDAITKYFKYQRGISESYRGYKPVYSMDERMLMLEREEWEYPESNVGSKSNYMFLHLCYFLGLHDLLLENKNTMIPQFLFIDQPSIPYYADRNATQSDTSDTIANDDREKLLEAFRLIDKFMREVTCKGHFQIIMIEHAGTEYWHDLSTFETRYEFRNGEGLIPSHIIENKQ